MSVKHSAVAHCPSMGMIASHAHEGVLARQKFFDEQSPLLRQCALLMAKTLTKGRKILFCGNGGSAADSQHLAAEFVNRFLIDRPALPAIALTTDTSILTAIGNDSTFEQIFSRQIQALGHPEDILVAFSTSGTSPNILAALQAARQREMYTIGLTGQNQAMQPFCDHLLCVPHAATPIIQEIHIAAGHILCMLVDYFLFENVAALTNSEVADENME